jgi:hypothetical protein
MPRGSDPRRSGCPRSRRLAARACQRSCRRSAGGCRRRSGRARRRASPVRTGPAGARGWDVDARSDDVVAVAHVDRLCLGNASGFRVVEVAIAGAGEPGAWRVEDLYRGAVRPRECPADDLVTRIISTRRRPQSGACASAPPTKLAINLSRAPTPCPADRRSQDAKRPNGRAIRRRGDARAGCQGLFSAATWPL